MSDGGTVWVDPVTDSSNDTKHHDVSPVVKEYGMFAYLEGLLTSDGSNWAFASNMHFLGFCYMLALYRLTFYFFAYIFIEK